MIGETFERLKDSSHDLIYRFGVGGDPQAAWRKFIEEVDELAEAADYGEGQDIAEEAVDVLATLINFLDATEEVDDDLLEWAMQRVIAKNDAKNFDTHVVVEGLIVRKDKIA